MAQKIPKEVINDIQERVSIVDVVGKYVQLKKQGANYFGLCPFQSEKTPSFSVSEEKKIFHCFSCGRGGSVFSFIMMIDNLSFVEAVAKAAEMGGVSFDAYRYRTNSLHQRVSEPVSKVLKFTENFYHHILKHTEIGKQALEYLSDRNILPSTIEHFNMGYAPSNNLLTDALTGANDLTNEAIIKSGVVNESEQKKYDYFKDRIMIPISDEEGNLVGFGGRSINAIEPDEPRYLNSKQNDIFNKSNLLFNLNQARQEIALKHEVFLLEGYFDVISAWQAGVKNAVASMGTSFTSHQLNLLNKVTSQVVLVYDGDEAGKAAIDKAIDNLSHQQGLDVLVAPIPGGMDPDDYIKKYGGDSFRKLVTKDRVSKYRFRLDYYQEKYNFNNEHDLITYVDEILDKFVDLRNDPIQKELYLKELAKISGISLLNLQNQFNQHVKTNAKHEDRVVRHLVQPRQVKAETRFERAQQELLFLALNNNLFDWLDDKHWFFPNTDYQIIYELFAQYYRENQGEVHFFEFVNELPTELANIATTVNSLDRPLETDEKEVMELISVIKKESLENQILKTQQEIDEYQKLGQKENLNQSVKKMIELIRMKQQEVS